MKNFKQTKQFLFRIFLAGIFLILYAVTASAVPVSAQGGISDDQRKASASLIKLDAYQGLDEAELSSGVWQFCGRAEHGALTGETYYDGALYVETLGDRSGGFVFEGARTAGLAHHPDGPLKPLCGLYGGKERMRDGGLNDYDFSARRLNSALALWTAPDPMARDFSSINPYVYCASNPIRYTDPSGCLLLETDKVYFFESKTKIDLTDANGNKVTYNLGTVFSSDGTPIPVLKSTDSNINNKSNCHGLTFLEGEYCINSDDALNTILSEYTQVASIEEAEIGDVVMFETKRTGETEDMADGEYIKAHSATISAFNEDGTVTMEAKDGWNEVREEKYFSQKGNYEKTSIFRKSRIDRQINENEKKALNKEAKKVIQNYEKKVEEIKNKKNNNN